MGVMTVLDFIEGVGEDWREEGRGERGGEGGGRGERGEGEERRGEREEGREKRGGEGEEEKGRESLGESEESECHCIQCGECETNVFLLWVSEQCVCQTQPLRGW